MGIKCDIYIRLSRDANLPLIVVLPRHSGQVAGIQLRLSMIMNLHGYPEYLHRVSAYIDIFIYIRNWWYLMYE